MGVTNSNKELSVTQINCDGSFSVRLSLAAEPDIVSNPTDIVLILDRSGSMEGTPLENLKSGALKFIEIIDESTDGTSDGQIGGGSHIGIVSFATTATQDTQLITSVADLNAAVNALDADGFTNHEDAFTKALDLFDPASTNAKVMVMFTDGVTTAGGDPATVAAAAKAQGIVIYAIGLSGNGGIDEDALDDWASDPSSAFVVIAPDDADLEEIFEDLARNISNPGATDIIIEDTVSDCFRITSVSAPTKGTATIVGPTAVRWTIDELGVTQSEGATLDFTVEHTGDCTGLVEVNEAIEYSDNEGNVVAFPSPAINIDCGLIVIPEDCPVPVDITVGGCEDFIEFDAGELALNSLGRVLEVDVTISNVCPGKRVALAAILTEVDDNGDEQRRALKTMTIPAHTAESCRNVTVRCIKFVLPEDIDTDGTTTTCNERNLRVRFIAHYIDSNYNCCNTLFE